MREIKSVLYHLIYLCIKLVLKSETMKQQYQQGLWLFDGRSLQLGWAGAENPPVPSPKERLWFAICYIRSNGYGPTFISCIKRLAKAIAFCLKPSQVSWSGKPNITTGRSVEDEWASFSLNPCLPPQVGHGSSEIFRDKTSN